MKSELSSIQHPLKSREQHSLIIFWKIKLMKVSQLCFLWFWVGQCHEEQKNNKDKLANSSSKTREIKCLHFKTRETEHRHSPISMNATYKHKTHETNKRLFWALYG